MREVKLAYRLHITSLASGRQWYFGESAERPEGFIWYDKVELSWITFPAHIMRSIIWDIEEYEINPEEDHVCNR